MRTGGSGGGGAGRLLAVDRLLVGYLAVTGLLSAAAGGTAGLAIAGIHALAILGILRIGRRLGGVATRGGWRGLLRVAYPVALTPLLYAELARVNRFLTERYYDAGVQAWEAAVFGGQPSVEAALRWPSFWLSEFLHLGYFSYYLVVPLALVGVFLTRDATAAHRTAFAVALAFFASYLAFAVFPVSGPRYLFPPIGGEIGAGRLYGLVHAVLEGGSSRGTAFPSSHVAASGAGVLLMWREDRRWFWLLLVPWLALTAGTVYGRFHYAVDAAAGVLLALGAAAAAPGLVRRLGPCLSSTSGTEGVAAARARSEPPAPGTGAPDRATRAGSRASNG